MHVTDNSESPSTEGLHPNTVAKLSTEFTPNMYVSPSFNTPHQKQHQTHNLNLNLNQKQHQKPQPPFMTSYANTRLNKSGDSPTAVLRPMTPPELREHINGDQEIVIIDVRPFSMYSHNHIKGSKSLCIPSTLLKRQTFGFERIMDFVAPQDIDTLRNIDKASKIVFYDHSSFQCTSDSSLNRTGLKIISSNMELKSKLFWLVGGINAAINEIPDTITTGRRQSSLEDAPDLNQLNSIDVPVFHQSPVGKTKTPKSSLAPKSPFGLMPVLTSLNDNVNLRSPLQTPGSGHHNDDAYQKLITDESVRYMHKFPKWLATVLTNVRDGQNVISEGFNMLQIEESNRINGPSSFAFNLPASKTSSTTKLCSLRMSSPRSIMTSPSSNNMQTSPCTPRSEVSVPSLGNLTPQYALNNNGSISDFESPLSFQQKFAIIAGDDPGKNRYTNIAPYDHCRIVLSGGKYLNASSISSSVSPLTYIASQAPVPASFSDFWWCVWERRVPMIVMLTTLKTLSGRLKAHSYWKEYSYDGLHVKVVEKKKVDVSGVPIVVRKIELTLRDERREVHQLHYEGWPDLGCPSDPEEVLKLVEYKTNVLGKITNNTMLGEVIVHCSAGCGRTGTFCTIDLTTDILRNERSYNCNRDLIFDIVSELREQRMSMVQNQKQYLMCYQAVILWLIRRIRRADKKEMLVMA